MIMEEHFFITLHIKDYYSPTLINLNFMFLEIIQTIKRNRLQFITLCLFLFFYIDPASSQGSVTVQSKNKESKIWTEEKINSWYTKLPWIRGCNFIPSSAINQIEMWQADTFDSKTIDRELGWAQELGFNTMRVYLSSLVWKADSKDFKKRMKKYLAISSKHKIRTIFVFFDDCWNEESALGKQPEPKPGVHNSGWVQDPAISLRKDTTKLYSDLEAYVSDILQTFKNDKRVLVWDLYNEPGNNNYVSTSIPLLKHVFKWAKQVNPSQPVTSGAWCYGCTEITDFQLINSDIITYHCYSNEQENKGLIDMLKKHKRPLICTEYMARKNESRFENIMPLLKENKVGAINWGFVAGKTNTIFAWDEPLPKIKEPAIWFHDILRTDKTPFDQKEIDLIKKLNGK